MENINWDNLSISLQYKAGQITDKKIDKILNELKEAGITVAAVVRPNPEITVFSLDDKGCMFIILPDSISYTIQNVPDRYSIAYQHLLKIMDLMSVEDQNMYVINIQGSSIGANSHAESKNRFNEEHRNILNQYDDIYGIGYRFLIKNELYSGELKIEPMVSDSTKYFHQYVINTLSNMHLKALIELIKVCVERDFDSLREVL